MIYAATLGANAAQPGLWEALAEVLQQNPVLTLIGWSLAVFVAGFAARRYFQDRELDRVKNQLLDVEKQLNTASMELRSIREAEEESKSRIDRIADCIGPRELKKQLARLLGEWPADKHDLIVAGVARQLIVTPGRAWLCTPSGSTLVKVDWDEEQGRCRFSSETNSSVDPIKELREFLRKPEALATVLLDLAVHGITSVADRIEPTKLKVIKVRQGPGLAWQVQTQILEAVPE